MKTCCNIFFVGLFWRRSSAGESVRFIPVRSWVRSPPPLSKIKTNRYISCRLVFFVFERKSELVIICLICGTIAVRDRSGRMLSVGTASASAEENHFLRVFRHVLFPQESPPYAHPDWLEQHHFYFDKPC